MGLSASQARYLQLTARRNDNEYEAQQINNARSEIAKKMQDVSMKFSNGINNRMLNFTLSSGDGTKVEKQRLTYNNVTAEYPAGLGYQLVDKYGTEVRPNEKSATALRKEAVEELAEAKKSKTFRFPTVDEEGNQTYTQIDGSNFNKFLGQHDTVINKNGDIVDSETFQKNIANMDATQFNNYWNLMGFSFASGSTMEEYQDPEMLKDAEKSYEAKLKEADEIESKSCIYDDRCLDSSYLENQLRTGEWTLLKPCENQFDEKGNRVWEEINYSNVALISDELDKSDDASITNEYDTKMDYYQQKDKELELQLQRLETSHNAIQTELDSVKKVIDKNVEKSFKTFG
ncbi:MAG: hypothetical protein ACI37Z_00400 [Candidatus Gastranaerophilaceae bacterium]